MSQPESEWPAGEVRFEGAALFRNPHTRKGDGRWIWSTVDRAWKRACAQVGLHGVRLYEGTKHSMATDAIRRGVQERHLQVFLGHADVRSTRRYARLGEQALVTVPRVQDADDLSPACRQLVASPQPP